jgi:hypothetical protein
VKDEVPGSSPVGGDRWCIILIGNESWWVGSCLNKILVFNF